MRYRQYQVLELRLFKLFSCVNAGKEFFMLYDEETGEVLEILDDTSGTGRDRPWKLKRENTEKLKIAYDVINPKKAERLEHCATYLEYEVSVVDPNKKRLRRGNFCKVRLCPMCAWRRSLKIYSQMSSIMAEAKKNEQYAYVFLTLTVKNCEGEELKTTIDNMMKAWNRFRGYKAIDDVVLGWYRGLEVTHNLDDKSESYDTYHPHFHVVLMVNKSYFTSRYYLKQADWQAYWRKAMRLDYDPQVDVRKVKGDKAKAVSEIAKYTVKDDDYIIDEDEDMMIKTVRLLDKALAGKRLVAFGGVFKDLHKQLNLDDIEDGDLVHVEADELNEQEETVQVAYMWHVGYKQYIKR